MTLGNFNGSCNNSAIVDVIDLIQSYFPTAQLDPIKKGIGSIDFTGTQLRAKNGNVAIAFNVTADPPQAGK